MIFGVVLKTAVTMASDATVGTALAKAPSVSPASKGTVAVVAAGAATDMALVLILTQR